MGNVQPNYNATLDIGYEGQPADTRLSDVVSRICEPASIGFGKAVIKGTGDKQVKLGAGGIFEGVTIRDIALPAANADTYLLGDTVGVMRKGSIFAVAIAAVNAGDPVYRTATGTLTNVAGSRSAVSAVKASGANTGDGAMGAVTAGAAAQVGVYELRIVDAATNAGKFQVVDPQGDVVGIGNVAAAFNGGGLSFTLADGAADFIVGDGFDITVSDGNTLIEGAAWERTVAQDAIGKVRLN